METCKYQEFPAHMGSLEPESDALDFASLFQTGRWTPAAGLQQGQAFSVKRARLQNIKQSPLQSPHDQMSAVEQTNIDVQSSPTVMRLAPEDCSVSLKRAQLQRSPLDLSPCLVESVNYSNISSISTTSRLALQPVPDLQATTIHLNQLSASDLAADMSETLYIGSGRMPTPRKTLFQSPLPSAVSGQARGMQAPPRPSEFMMEKENLVFMPAKTSTPVAGRQQVSVKGSIFGSTRRRQGSRPSGIAPDASSATPRQRSRLPTSLPIMSTPNLPRDTSCDISSGSPSFLAPSPLARGVGLRDSFDFKSNLSGGSAGSKPHKVRRTQSMFQSTEQFLSQQLSPPAVLSTPLGAIMGSGGIGSTLDDDLQECASVLSRSDCDLETFSVNQDSFLRIKRETLCSLLDGNYDHLYEQVVVVDCRFEYEYEGGHIAGAINISSKAHLEQKLLAQVQEIKSRVDGQTLLVFHCEYSAYRGPLMANHLRQLDRRVNMAQYPQLHYPDIVILDGGYSHFFQLHNTRCEPQNYVGMNDSSHQKTCERELDKFRHNMRLRKAPTFTYGQGSPGRPPFRFPNKDDTRDTPCRGKPNSRPVSSKFL